jgi:GAF domain-containing protein
MSHSACLSPTCAAPLSLPLHCPPSPIPTWGTQPIIDQPISTQSIVPVNSSLELITQDLQNLPRAKLELALQKACEELQAIGIRLYVGADAEHADQWYEAGLQPQLVTPLYGDEAPRPVEQHLCWQQVLQRWALERPLTLDGSVAKPVQPWIVPYLQLDFQLRTLAAAFQPIGVNQLLVMPLYGQMLQGPIFEHATIDRSTIKQPVQLLGSLSIFRTEMPWQDEEIELLQQIGQEFAKAIAQHRQLRDAQRSAANCRVNPSQIQIITEQHGGESRCFSQVGIGTEFQIEIPLTK